MQDRPIEYHIATYENFIDMVLDSILQMTFMKLPLLNSGVVLKNIYHYLKQQLKHPFIFQPCICVSESGLFFLHIKTKQQIMLI